MSQQCTVVLSAWTPDDVWKVGFETEWVIGDAYQHETVQDAIDAAQAKAREQDMRVVGVESIKLD